MVKTILSLNEGSFDHQVLQLTERTKRLVPSPSSLNLYSGKYRTVGTFEHLSRIFHRFENDLEIGYA